MLYLIGTPIGNLQDMTFRAVETLKNCPVVLVEKWSDSIKLLDHYEITAEKIFTYDDRNCRRTTPGIIKLLASGQEIALITSAGMPGISDPGAYLVNACRMAKIPVVPIPGPSALSTVIAISGFSGNFLFVGFLPKKIGATRKLFAGLLADEYNLVFYESTFRLEKTLRLLAADFPDLELFIGKEMTKKFERYLFGRPADLLEIFSADKKSFKGEFSIIARASSWRYNDEQ